MNKRTIPFPYIEGHNVIHFSKPGGDLTYDNTYFEITWGMDNHPSIKGDIKLFMAEKKTGQKDCFEIPIPKGKKSAKILLIAREEDYDLNTLDIGPYNR